MPRNEQNYSTLRYKGLLHGTIKDAKAKRAHRDALRLEPSARGQYYTIPIGSEDASKVGRMALEDRPRVQRWGSEMALGKSGPYGCDATDYGSWGVKEVDSGRYSRRCRYRKIDYYPFVRSYGYATATRLVATIWDTRYRYRAPRGWVFGIDDLGIYIIRTQEKRANYRYHVSSDDVRGGLSSMRAAGIRHEAEQRAANKRARLLCRIDKVEDAELARYGVWVTVADSRKAGNCASGTRTWAAHHGLDPRKRYPMKVIARLAATHPSVSRVLDMARHRTREELAQGFCLI